MKYFTPERYLALGNLTHEGAFRAAHEDWERAVQEYKGQLQRIQALLPLGLKRLVDSVYLHDAHLLDMWQGSRSRLTVTLQPETDPARLVVLTYSLVEPPRINERALPVEVHADPVAWLYDEVDVVQGAGKGDRSRGSPTWTHDFLLSNGWEVHLHFRKATVTRPTALIPGGPDGSVVHHPLPRSA